MHYHGKAYLIATCPGNRVGFDNDALHFYTAAPTAGGYQSGSDSNLQATGETPSVRAGCALSADDGFAVTNLKISSAKTRWGSTSVKRSVNFSWRLILADDEIFNIVVIHELAHIKQMNHSDKFWAEVEKIIPDWRKREKRLKEFSRMSNAQNWEVDRKPLVKNRS